jgi:GNAT superfamily N-acetyltransferase
LCIGIERYLLSWEASYNTFFDRTSNHAHLSQYSKARATQNAFYRDIAPYLHVSILATSPDYQRRGVGTLLVCEGQRLALLDDVPLVLESSLAGRGLYAKNGFEKLWEGKTCGLEDMSMVWCPGAENRWESEGEFEIGKERGRMLKKIGELKATMGRGMKEWGLEDNPDDA